MSDFNFTEYIEDNTLRCEASHRGGGIEISAEDFLHLPHAKMSAYQNYLGGGMLGSIQSDCNFNVSADAELQAQAELLAEELKRYFHNITNHEDDEWESASFEDNQSRPESAY